MSWAPPNLSSQNFTKWRRKPPPILRTSWEPILLVLSSPFTHLHSAGYRCGHLHSSPLPQDGQPLGGRAGASMASASPAVPSTVPRVQTVLKKGLETGADLNLEISLQENEKVYLPKCKARDEEEVQWSLLEIARVDNSHRSSHRQQKPVESHSNAYSVSQLTQFAQLSKRLL